MQNLLTPNIIFNMVFTEQARAQLRDFHYSFSAMPNLQPIPNVGDALIFPGLKSFSFVVIGRRWEYFENQDLTITFVLDLVSQEDRSAKLSLVDSEPTQA